MDSAPAIPVADSPQSLFARRTAAALLLAAVALWLFSGQGGLAHPVQLAARGLVIVALACVLLQNNLRVLFTQTLLLTLMLGWGAVSNWNSGCPYLAWQELLTWGTAAAAALVALAVTGGFPARRWWLLLAALLVITAVPEFIRNLVGFGAAGLGVNLTGLPGNSNVLGVILAMCLPAAAAAVANAHDRKSGLIVLPLLLAGLLLTYSRNAWLTAMLGFGAWWFLHFRGQRVKLLLLLMAFLLVLLAVPATRARLHAFIDPAHPSNLERVDLFRSVGKWLGEENRVWYGGALGQWGFTYPRLATLDKWQLHTHNVISEWLMGGGLPLALLGILLIISGFWGRIGDSERPAEALRRAQLLVLVVANLFDYLLWIPLTAFLFFAALFRQQQGMTGKNSEPLFLLVTGIVFSRPSRAMRRAGIIAAGCLLLVLVVLPLYAYQNYVQGLQLAGRGDWQEAVPYFYLNLHPVYQYYHQLAMWRSQHAVDIHTELMANDPYIYQQLYILSGETGRGLDFDKMRRLDPQEMIAGGEEFRQVPLVPCPQPEQMSDWQQLPEGNLLNCARNWSDSFPAAAQAAFRLALQKDPHHSPAYRYYAEFLQTRQQWPELIDEIAPALTVGGKRPEDSAIICDALAAVHAAQGDSERANKLRQAAQAARDNMVTRHAQVIRMMFHIPTLPRDGFNDN